MICWSCLSHRSVPGVRGGDLLRLPRVCLGSFWECGARGGTRTRLGRICACFHRRLTLPSLVPSHVHGIRHGTGSSLVDVDPNAPMGEGCVPSILEGHRRAVHRSSSAPFPWLSSTWHSSLALNRTEPAPVLVHSLFHGRIPGSLLASFLPFPLGHHVPTATIPRVRFPSVHGTGTSRTVLANSRARRRRGGGTSTFPFPP